MGDTFAQVVILLIVGVVFGLCGWLSIIALRALASRALTLVTRKESKSS